VGFSSPDSGSDLLNCDIRFLVLDGSTELDHARLGTFRDFGLLNPQWRLNHEYESHMVVSGSDQRIVFVPGV
jgi:hypothetical protein